MAQLNKIRLIFILVYSIAHSTSSYPRKEIAEYEEPIEPRCGEEMEYIWPESLRPSTRKVREYGQREGNKDKDDGLDVFNVFSERRKER